eukprot:2726245-Rhodomonas_salina.3
MPSTGMRVDKACCAVLCAMLTSVATRCAMRPMPCADGEMSVSVRMADVSQRRPACRYHNGADLSSAVAQPGVAERHGTPHQRHDPPVLA